MRSRSKKQPRPAARLVAVFLWSPLGLMSISALAHAQAAESAQPTTESGTSRPSRGELRGVPLAQQIAGEVRRVDMPQGVLVLRTNGGEVTLRAKPDRLDELSPGDRFEGSYTLYGDQPWLSEERNPGTELGALGETRRIDGWVDSWDRERGLLVLATPRGAHRFHIHPAEQEALLPGREVNVLYASVDGQDWVISVRDRSLPPPR